MEPKDHREQNKTAENTEVTVRILNDTFWGVIWMPGSKNILCTKIRIRTGVISLKSMTLKQEERI